MRQRANFTRWGFAEPGNNFSNPWFMTKDAGPELAWFALKAVPALGGRSVEEAQETLEEAGFQIGEIVHDYDHAIESGRVITARPFPAAPAGTPVEIVVSLGCYEWPASEGATGDPCGYAITSAGQLDCLAFQQELWSGRFRLESDLDMTGWVYCRSVLGGSARGEPAFNGVFDGNGHVIRNLTVQASPMDGGTVARLGLFGETGKNARIENLGLASVTVHGSRSTTVVAGMFCAANGGYIAQCYSEGVLRGHGELGGLVGFNLGGITNCYVEGSVENDAMFGALGNYAGLVARNLGGNIDTCYAACAVPLWYGGGLVGVNEGDMKGCLWDVEASGITYSTGGTGLSTEEMMSAQVLTDLGWGAPPAGSSKTEETTRG